MAVFLPIIFFQILAGQTDTACRLQISLLTCTPGDELYSSWGHSALRVKNAMTGSDIIYNYGTFDFDDPAFYSKFTRGKLLYFVSQDDFEDFVKEYEYEKRGITEQVLNLSCEEKQQLSTALQENAREENKYYKYDFMYDNCTTRLRDMVFKNAGSPVETKNILPFSRVSFRNLIHEYLNRTHQYWSKLGIDILLGMPLDKKLSNSESMFLPDYLLKGFDSTTVHATALVKEKKEILKAGLPENSAPFFSPMTIFISLFLIIMILGVWRQMDRFLNAFDFFFFFFCGMLGVFLVFMWFGTDHPECKNNLNLAWAFPFHFVLAFFIYRRWNWLKYYFLFNAFLLLLLLLSWRWLPQEMNNALLPLICLLLFRSFARYRKLNHHA